MKTWRPARAPKSGLRTGERQASLRVPRRAPRTEDRAVSNCSPSCNLDIFAPRIGIRRTGGRCWQTNRPQQSCLTPVHYLTHGAEMETSQDGTPSSGDRSVMRTSTHVGLLA